MILLRMVLKTLKHDQEILDKITRFQLIDEVEEKRTVLRSLTPLAMFMMRMKSLSRW